MNKKHLSRVCSLAVFLSASPLYSADYYQGGSGVFADDSTWYMDEALSTLADSHPMTFEDTAILHNTNGRLWVTQIDTYVGNIISAGVSNMQFGRELLGAGPSINFQVGGKIKAQICNMDENAFLIDTAFDGAEGEATLEMAVGGIEVGAEIYGAQNISVMGKSILTLDFSESQMKNSTVNVSGDVLIGGGLQTRFGAELYLVLDKMSVEGIVEMKRNAGSWSNIYFGKSAVLETGGLYTESMGDYTITHSNGAGDSVSAIILRNEAGSDYQYIGAIVSESTFNGSPDASAASINICMLGDGIQRIAQGVRDRTDITGKDAGVYSVESGKLFYDNSNLRADFRLAKLAVDGGSFGASYWDSSRAGRAYFKTAEIANGGLAYENFANHNALETGGSDKIVIAESLSKTGDGKISVDLADRHGNAFDLAGYEVAEDALEIDNWIEILTAGDLDGFDLESKIGDNAYDANGDFYAVNVENGFAFFRWVDLAGGGYSLQVGFAQVPEPAAVAAVFGALAFLFAARLKIK